MLGELVRIAFRLIFLAEDLIIDILGLYRDNNWRPLKTMALKCHRR